MLLPMLCFYFITAQSVVFSLSLCYDVTVEMGGHSSAAEPSAAVAFFKTPCYFMKCNRVLTTMPKGATKKIPLIQMADEENIKHRFKGIGAIQQYRIITRNQKCPFRKLDSVFVRSKQL